MKFTWGSLLQSCNVFTRSITKPPSAASWYFYSSWSCIKWWSDDRWQVTCDRQAWHMIFFWIFWYRCYYYNVIVLLFGWTVYYLVLRFCIYNIPALYWTRVYYTSLPYVVHMNITNHCLVSYSGVFHITALYCTFAYTTLLPCFVLGFITHHCVALWHIPQYWVVLY